MRADVSILFFDVGNVFVSDDPSGCFAYRRLHEWLVQKGHSLHPGDFFRQRAEHVENGGSLWSFVAQFVPQEDFVAFQKSVRAELYSRWPHFSPEIPGMADAARELSRYYRLGLIANQPCEVEELLRERDLLDLFQVRAISDAVGVAKPDERLFRWALDRAGVDPQDAIMIGDRIDNDIKPAKQLGMRAVWLRLGFADRGWTPTDEFESCFVESLGRASWSDVEPVSSDETPDYIARSPAELVQILKPRTEGRSGSQE